MAREDLRPSTAPWTTVYIDGVLVVTDLADSQAAVPREGGTGSATVVADAPANEERALDDAVARIVRDHPDADVAVITALLRTAHRATADAKVQGFRVVLAERSARASLRRRPSPAASGGRSTPGDPE